MLWIYDEVILSYFILYKDLFCGVWIKYFVFVRSIFYFLNGLWCLLGLEKYMYMYVVFYIYGMCLLCLYIVVNYYDYLV